MTGDVTRVGGLLCYVTPDGELAVCDTGRDGQTIVAARDLAPGATPLPSGGESVLCFDRAYALRLCPLAGDGATGAAARVWIEDTSSLGGKPATPLVLVGGNVYVGWSGWGLVSLGGRM